MHFIQEYAQRMASLMAVPCPANMLEKLGLPETTNRLDSTIKGKINEILASQGVPEGAVLTPEQAKILNLFNGARSVARENLISGVKSEIASHMVQINDYHQEILNQTRLMRAKTQTLAELGEAPRIKSAREIVEEFAQNKFFSVLKATSNEVDFVTKDVYMRHPFSEENIPLGSFQIRMTAHGSMTAMKNKGNNFYRVPAGSLHGHVYFVHPFIRGGVNSFGNLCYGDATEEVRELILKDDWKGIADITQAILTTYDKNVSPYVALDKFPVDARNTCKTCNCYINDCRGCNTCGNRHPSCVCSLQKVSVQPETSPIEVPEEVEDIESWHDNEEEEEGEDS